MKREIERKFIIDPSIDYSSRGKSFPIKQAYLNSHPDRTTRVRLKGNKAYLTIKGKSSDDGLTRFEWEKEISVSVAEELFKLCEPGMISKTRTEIMFEGILIEVDVFHGELAGLYMAEVELESEDQQFNHPTWFEKEVTGDPQYYNSNLSQHGLVKHQL